MEQHHRNIVIVGDILLDHMISTKIQTPKRKDYLTEYNLESETYALGGCGNVAANLRSLGADSIVLFSAIGPDEYGKRIEELLAAQNITNCLRVVPSYHTTVKHRYYHNNSVVFQHANSINKELLTNVSFCKDIEEILQTNEIHCILLCESETSSHGILSFSHCQQILALATDYGIPTFVDPKEDILKYAGCTLIKPNRDEAYDLLGLDRVESLPVVHRTLCARLRCAYSMITLSEDGISLMDGNEILHSVYQGEPLHVVDPIGGGDIVMSILAFYYPVLPFSDILRIAAQVASKSVEHTGVVVVSNRDIRLSRFPSKVLGWDDLPVLRLLVGTGILGVTTGCFDLFHEGHLRSLQWCRANCDVLVVCINSDASVRALKGSDRPVQPLSERMAAVLPYADYIVVLEDTTAVECVQRVRPDVFLKGGDYVNRVLPESAFAAETRYGPYLEGVSTTEQISASIRKDGEDLPILQ